MSNLIYNIQNPKGIEVQKEERDNYIREREKYITLNNLKVLLPCMSKSNPQCSFFCKNYYNCMGDKDGQN